ncbi:MAG: hypothetical protein LLG45_13225 [Actinomycetia bacterium]|nr:hypothetical protein [Actinomycetes bacterium]
MTCTGRKADGSLCAEWEKPLRVVTVWYRPTELWQFGTTNQVQRHHLCSACIARLADDPEVEAYMVHWRE